MLGTKALDVAIILRYEVHIYVTAEAVDMTLLETVCGPNAFNLQVTKT